MNENFNKIKTTTLILKNLLFAPAVIFHSGILNITGTTKYFQGMLSILTFWDSIPIRLKYLLSWCSIPIKFGVSFHMTTMFRYLTRWTFHPVFLLYDICLVSPIMSFLELLAMFWYLKPTLTHWFALKNAKTTTLW